MNKKYAAYFIRQWFYIIATLGFIATSLTILSNRLTVPFWQVDWFRLPTHHDNHTTVWLESGQTVTLTSSRMVVASLSLLLLIALGTLLLSYTSELFSRWRSYRKIKRGEDAGDLIRS